MSLFVFGRNFFAVQGNQAAKAVTKALVQLDPEGASAADLMTMEQDLDKAGEVISKLRHELATEQQEFQSVNKQYGELMGAAELLQRQIAEPDVSPDKKTSLETSLATLLDRIEHVAPELERDQHDVAATQALLTEAEKAYQEKAKALTEAKGNLDRARHDLQRANIEQERSVQRAQQAAVVAGLASSPMSGLTIALSTMQESAQDARDKAAAADMKASALKHADAATEDQNVTAALNEVRGTISTKSLSERLAQLRR